MCVRRCQFPWNLRAISGPGLLCGLGWLAIWASTVSGQEQPRFVLTSGGPTVTVRALQFSGDSRRLYVAGSDKAVEVWEVPERSQPQFQLQLQRHLRWEIARGDRGVIYDLAVNPRDGTVVIGGYGARMTKGDLSLFQPVTGQQLAVLPKIRDDRESQANASGHRETVTGLSYSPNGQRLASVSLDGELRIWSAPQWSSEVLPWPGRRPDLLGDHRVLFLTDSLVIVSPAVSGAPLYAAELNANGQTSRFFALQSQHSGPNGGPVTTLARMKGTNWVSTDAVGRITVWNQLQTLRSWTLPESTRIYDASAAEDGRLAVTTWRSQALPGEKDQVVRGRLWLFPAEANRAEQAEQLSLGQFTLTDYQRFSEELSPSLSPPYAVALSPNGRFLAASRLGTPEVSVISLVDAQGRPLAQPFAQPLEVRLRGAGKVINRIAFAKQPPTLLAMGETPRATDPWTRGFDLTTGDITPAGVIDEQFEPAHPALPPGWKLTVAYQPDAKRRTTILLVEHQPTRRQWHLTLNLEGQGLFTTYTWLFQPKNDQPVAVAVGTRRENGVFIYELTDDAVTGGAPREARLIRYYRDHSDGVVSLSQSANCQWLASAGQDQTIRLWSLEGLFLPVGDNSEAVAWGGTLEIRNQRLRVATLDESGILASRQLQVGDVLTGISYAGRNGATLFVDDPQAMLSRIRSQPLTESLMFQTERGGVPQPPFIITPAWEPLVSLFIDQREEWAMWTSQGYFNASVNGDQLFGWHQNRARGEPPLFHSAETFRHELERPNLMKELISTRSMSAALRVSEDVAFGEPPARARPTKTARELASTVPEVRIVQPLSQALVEANQRVTLMAEVILPPGGSLDSYRIVALANQREVAGAVQVQSGRVVKLTWNVECRHENTELEVVIREKGPLLNPMALRDKVRVEAKNVAAKGRKKVHILSIGAQNYPQRGMALDYCISDAEKFRNAIQSSQLQDYALGELELLTDREKDTPLRRDAFRRNLSSFAERVNENRGSDNDLLLVYVAGHGQAVKRQYYFIPPDAQIGMEFREFDAEDVMQNAIPWTMFSEFVEQANTRTMFFMDTCYSGNIVHNVTNKSEQAKTRLETDKAMMRAVRDLPATVLAATSKDKLAMEDASNKASFFSVILMQGWNGAADGYSDRPVFGGKAENQPDGYVSLAETIGYVVQNVHRRYGAQRPTYTPTASPQFLQEQFLTVPKAVAKAR